MLNAIRLLLPAAALIVSSLSVHADGLPMYYPASFDQTGIVAQTGGGKIIIDASAFAIDSNVRVHTPTTQFSSMGSVSGGTEVGFNIDRKQPGNRKKITEIWVLPKGTVILP
jgi:hypothetical protein